MENPSARVLKGALSLLLLQGALSLLRESDSDRFPIQWQSQRKNRAGAGLAFDRHAPAVQFGDFADESQSKSGTRRLGVFHPRHAKEFLENARLVFRRNSVSLI